MLLYIKQQKLLSIIEVKSSLLLQGEKGGRVVKSGEEERIQLLD